MTDVSNQIGSVTQADLLRDREEVGSNVAMFYPLYEPSIDHNRPPFTAFRIRDMMRDPRIRFGLGLIKGPIHSETLFLTKAESEDTAVGQMVVELDIDFPYVVDTGDNEIDEYVVAVLERFWANGVMKALSAVEWGFSAMEVIYRQDQDGLIDYEDVRLFPQGSCRTCTLGDRICGVVVDRTSTRNVITSFAEENTDGVPGEAYIGIPKLFYHTHQRERNPIYGESRLYNCYAPWWEIWSRGGARDIRRTWFFTHAYDGGTMYYKPGQTRVNDQVVRNNKDIAVELLQSLRTGGFRLFPNEVDPTTGNPYWAYEPPSGNATPTGMMEYYDSLSTEELEGMGIPPEVVEGGGGGLGAATGRKIPEQAFRSTLRQSADFLIYDFDKQVLDALLYFRYGGMIQRTIKLFRPKQAFNVEAMMGPQGPEGTEGEEGTPAEDEEQMADSEGGAGTETAADEE